MKKMEMDKEKKEVKANGRKKTKEKCLEEKELCRMFIYVCKCVCFTPYVIWKRMKRKYGRR